MNKSLSRVHMERNRCQLFNDQCSHHIETSQLIYRANQLTGFYMMGTLVVKGLRNALSRIDFIMSNNVIIVFLLCEKPKKIIMQI